MQYFSMKISLVSEFSHSDYNGGDKLKSDDMKVIRWISFIGVKYYAN